MIRPVQLKPTSAGQLDGQAVRARLAGGYDQLLELRFSTGWPPGTFLAPTHKGLVANAVQAGKGGSAHATLMESIQ